MTNTTTQQARVLTKTDVRILRYLLPEGWLTAAGMLKGKKRQHPLHYQKTIRKEWGKRLKRMAPA